MLIKKLHKWKTFLGEHHICQNWHLSIPSISVSGLNSFLGLNTHGLKEMELRERFVWKDDAYNKTSQDPRFQVKLWKIEIRSKLLNTVHQSYGRDSSSLNFCKILKGLCIPIALHKERKNRTFNFFYFDLRHILTTLCHFSRNFLFLTKLQHLVKSTPDKRTELQDQMDTLLKTSGTFVNAYKTK